MMQRKDKELSPALFSLFFAVFCVILALIGAVLIFISTVLFKNTGNSAEKSYLPVSGDLPITVIIDAGHGGEDGGAVGKDGKSEKELNLSIAETLCDMLRACGINTVMTRTDDRLLYDRNVDYKGRKKSLDLRARLDIEKSIPNSVFVSIHMNAFPSEKESGLQVWYSKNAPGSRDLASNIQTLIKDNLQAENKRKIKAADSSIYLLNRAEDCAVLIECGFLSNPEECKKLSDEDYRKALSFVICLAIREYCENNSCK